MNTVTAKKHTVGLKDLRENMETYIKRVGKGETFIVFRRSEAIFRITPVNAERDDDWETVVDFTDIHPNGVPAKDILKALGKMHG